jgi:hypothetical protein
MKPETGGQVLPNGRTMYIIKYLFPNEGQGSITGNKK